MRISPLFPAVLLASLAGPVRAADCVVLGAPTNLAGVVEDYTGANGPYRTIHLTWKRPVLTSPEAQEVAIRDKVERRDVTSSDGAPWTVVFRGLDNTTYSTDGGIFNGIRGTTDPPTLCSLITCTDPGRTYEFRVSVEYAYKPGCTQYDAGKYTNTTPPSNTFRIAIPGPPPKPPENVRAVASAKKKQVTVAWTADGGEGFRVERRRVPSGPAAKADDEYTLVAETAGSARSVVDRTVDPGEVFEYRVSAMNGSTAVAGPADSAYPPVVCPAPAFNLWEDETLLVKSLPIRLDFDDSGPDETPLVALVRYLRPTSEGELPLPPVTLMDDTPGKDSLGDPTIAFKGTLVTPFNEFATVPAGSKLSLVVGLDADDPFDSEAWTKGQVRIRAGHLNLVTDAAFDADSNWSTRVCGSLAAGSVKKETVPVGRVVAFLFRMIALGPNPLLANRVKLDVTVEGGKLAGGRIVSRIEQISFSIGASHAQLVVGALGPLSPTRSEEAAIVILAVADTYPADGQLRLRVKPEAQQGDVAAYLPSETIELLRDEYVAEVFVAAPKPAK